MIIKCIRCKSEFEQQRNERACGCRTPSSMKIYESQRIAAKIWTKENHDNVILRQMKIHYQNPIYQWIREFITTETFTQYSSFKPQALRF